MVCVGNVQGIQQMRGIEESKKGPMGSDASSTPIHRPIESTSDECKVVQSFSHLPCRPGPAVVQ